MQWNVVEILFGAVMRMSFQYELILYKISFILHPLSSSISLIVSDRCFSFGLLICAMECGRDSLRRRYADVLPV